MEKGLESKMSVKDKIMHMYYTKFTPELADALPGREIAFLYNQEKVGAKDIARAAMIEGIKIGNYVAIAAYAAQNLF